MAHSQLGEITEILVAIGEDSRRDENLRERLYARAYPKLRQMARRIMTSERAEHTLQPTALINEAYCALVEQSHATWRNRAQFLSVAARIMRRVLIDYARARSRDKRGGDWRRVTLSGIDPRDEMDLLELIVLDDSLRRLHERSERMARVVELKVFGGLTVPEIAHVIGVSERTVQGDWSFARRWIAGELAAKAADGHGSD